MNDIATDAINAAVKEKPSIVNDVDALINASYKKFIEMKLDDFPRMCEVAMMQNKIRYDELRAIGNTGKYTDSIGWSNDGTFKWEFDIPQDLYLFMTNLVYKGFWDKQNKKISRAFMNAICRGDDPMTTLMKVKSYYGSTKEVFKEEFA